MHETAPRVRPRSPRRRDREATIRGIREAAVSVLAEVGVHGFTVQVVANRANVDKKLIYYYFQDVQGLQRVVGDSLLAELAKRQGADGSASYGSRVSSAICARARALKATPALTRLLASCLAGTQMGGFGPLLSLTGEPEVTALGIPPSADAAAASAVMFAGVTYLVLLDQAGGSLSGVDVSEPEGMNRLLRVVSAMATAVLEPKATETRP